MAFIFVASTGRCGTKFLSVVWKEYTEYPSLHEPVPFCAGQTLREVNNECGINSDTHRELKTKILQILEDQQNGNYFESNQMFIKSYVSRVVYDKRFRPLFVIYLYRDPVSMVMSYYKKIPGKDLSWSLQPQWQKSLMKGHKGMSFMDIQLWNHFEIRERFLTWRDKFDKAYELDFKKLNDPREHARIFDHFEVSHRALPKIFPEGFYHLQKSLNAIPRNELEVLQEMRESWDERGQDTTQSAQQHFFELVDKRIEELKKNE